MMLWIIVQRVIQHIECLGENFRTAMCNRKESIASPLSKIESLQKPLQVCNHIQKNEYFLNLNLNVSVSVINFIRLRPAS